MLFQQSGDQLVVNAGSLSDRLRRLALQATEQGSTVAEMDACLRCLIGHAEHLREGLRNRTPSPVPDMRPPAKPKGPSSKKWNDEHEVGTPVRYWRGARRGEGRTGRTRSLAWDLCGSPVVSIEGTAGGIALTHVEVIAESELVS